ncbi:hypothetical protein MAPG_01733 [Magnaporthiopsis poae ATCC 64411]|uniref:BZIP domain-containing protein n=1 Tax=Magnaporthiopsis poae (strain ATCC 64411 / 73-15) TaxID=644358 RepID=A0A0C4DPG8_MAGP6|nr:hypothetical protein MAPG_01733 [Magnaporthiopsis poae ATCC 64411]
MSPSSSQSSQSTRAPRRAARQRIRKDPPPLAVPDINDDAAERKRVLNVLAQRRYRQRKKQQPLATEVTSSVQRDTLQTSNSEPERVQESQNPQAHGGDEDELASTGLELLPKGPGLSNGDPFGMFLGSNWMLPGLDDTISTTGPSSTETDPPPPINNSVFGDLTFDPMNFATLLPGSSSSSSSSSSDSLGPGAANNIVGSDSFSFPDTYLLPVPQLTLVRALLRIAGRLGCTSTIWDIKTLSPFNGPGGCESAGRHLPETWRPTPTQAKVLHHPVLDLVPWPSARDRLISIFSLPESMRPPSAAGPLGLIHFVYDLENASEGLRMYGGDPYDAECWEVGQTLFEKWWFVFDREIVNQSNRWRSLRGASKLRLEAASARSGDPEVV